MPVPYHLDESDSDSIVSSIFSFYIFLWSFFHSISDICKLSIYLFHLNLFKSLRAFKRCIVMTFICN